MEITYHSRRRTVSKLEKYNFSGERNNHWLGKGNCIKTTATLLPSHGYSTK